MTDALGVKPLAEIESLLLVTETVPVTAPAAPEAERASFPLVLAKEPTTDVVPDDDDVSLAFVRDRDPTTVVVPAALIASFAFVLARVPETATPADPDAANVSFALVRAAAPVTVVVPLAEDVSLAFVDAAVPATPEDLNSENPQAWSLLVGSVKVRVPVAPGDAFISSATSKPAVALSMRSVIEPGGVAPWATP